MRTTIAILSFTACFALGCVIDAVLGIGPVGLVIGVSCGMSALGECARQEVDSEITDEYRHNTGSTLR